MDIGKFSCLLVVIFECALCCFIFKRASNLGGLLSKDSGSMDALNESTSVSASDFPEIMVSDADTSDVDSNASVNSNISAKINLKGLSNFKSEIQQKWSAVRIPG